MWYPGLDVVLVFLTHQIDISAVFTHVRYIYLINQPYQPPEGGGGTLIFSYIRRLGPFFWGGGGENFEFQYPLGFSEK